MSEGKTSAAPISETNGSTSYSEKWSLHPGEALRRKRGLSAKEQQARAKHPVVLPQEVFESRALRRKAFHADKDCLIFCGEVREVLGWLREAGVFADCIVTSPPFYGQRDYGLFRLRTPGYRVFTVSDLRGSGYPGTAGGEIYAVFEVSEDPAFSLSHKRIVAKHVATVRPDGGSPAINAWKCRRPVLSPLSRRSAHTKCWKCTPKFRACVLSNAKKIESRIASVSRSLLNVKVQKNCHLMRAKLRSSGLCIRIRSLFQTVHFDDLSPHAQPSAERNDFADAKLDRFAGADVLLPAVSVVATSIRLLRMLDCASTSFGGLGPAV